MTRLVASRLDTTGHARRVEPLYFGCVELIEQHGSTRSSRHARHVESVVSCRDVTTQVEFGLNFASGLTLYQYLHRMIPSF